MRSLRIVIYVLIADQLSKYLVTQSIPFGESVQVLPGFFSITFVLNEGAAFGIFAGLSSGVRELVMGSATVLALGVLGWLYRHPEYSSVHARDGLALVLGGAFGNIIDRIRIGAVIDFFDVYVGNYHWPAFNIADSCICVGVGLLLFFGGKRQTLNRDERCE